MADGEILAFYFGRNPLSVLLHTEFNLPQLSRADAILFGQSYIRLFCAFSPRFPTIRENLLGFIITDAMGAMKAAIGDALITFVWMFCVSTLGAFTSIVSSALRLHGVVSTLGITTAFIAIIIFVFNVIADALGGASFNPTGNAAFYAAGLGGDSLFSMALRFPAQAAGAVGGVRAIMEFMPSQYKHTLGGPELKVDLHTGAVVEGVLTFLITFSVLWIVIQGPRSSIVKTWMLSVATVAMIVAGSGYTGPSMNPANAYGWAYINNRHNTWEQFYVYWICPLIGAILAAWGFRFFFPLPNAKNDKKD